jgi:tetratricopeptide (TPR) repeat protein
LIKRDLRADGANLNDNAVLTEIAQAFVYVGDSQFSLQVVERISNDNSKADALRAIAESYAKLGDKEKAGSLLGDAIKTAERISADSYKADALSAIAASIAKLAESSNDRTLYDKTFGLIEGFSDDSDRDKILDAVLSSKLAVADVSKLRSLATHYGVGGPGKARALARILMACSHPELIGKKEETGDNKDR